MPNPAPDLTRASTGDTATTSTPTSTSMPRSTCPSMSVTLCLRPFVHQQWLRQLAAWRQLRQRPQDRQAVLDWVELGERATATTSTCGRYPRGEPQSVRDAYDARTGL